MHPSSKMTKDVLTEYFRFQTGVAHKKRLPPEKIMMPALSTSELIEQIHTAARQMVVAITGGGSRAIAELLEVPGGSRTLLEAVVPYSAEALVKFLGGKPDQFCSARTARAMAMAGFQRARSLHCSSSSLSSLEEEKLASLIGIGCTASLVSDRPKQGSHRIHVAIQTRDVTATHSIELQKGKRSRVDEEAIASRMVLNAVAEAFGVQGRLTLPLIQTEQVQSIRTAASQNWQDLLLGRTNATQYVSTAETKPPSGNKVTSFSNQSIPRAVFPGAFNPLHAGHREMAEIASRQLNAPVHFEISVQNVDKLPLDYTEMEQRAWQFDVAGLHLWFTRAPTFEEKSAIFPGAIFVVGVDTLMRIGQPCYYHNDVSAAEAAIQQIADRNCRFLVFGRLIDGKFQTLDSLPISTSLRKLCQAVSANEFRADVSSTELRSKVALPVD